MREELWKSFDSLYIIDLHGKSLFLKNTPEGEVEQNVFDIQQGVAIWIAIRKKSHPDYFSTVYKKRDDDKLYGEIFYDDLWETREDKYKFLDEMNINSIEWIQLNPSHPHCFFSPKEFDLEEEYTKGWSVKDLFPINSSDTKTHRDHFVIDTDKNIVLYRFKDFGFYRTCYVNFKNRNVF